MLAMVAAGVALVAAGCSESAAPLDDPRLEVRELLTERTRALNAGDTEAYLEPVVGDARETEEAIAEGAQEVGLAQFEAVLVDADVNRETGEVTDAEIDLVYRYEGVPEDNQFRDRLVADFAPREDGWVVTDSEFEDPPPIWGSGPVEATRSEHFLALSRPGLREQHDPDELVALTERAYDRLIPELTLDEEPLYVAVLARDSDEFAALTDEDARELPPALATWNYSEAGMVNRVRAQSRKMVVNIGAVFGAHGGMPDEHEGQPTGEHHADVSQVREVFQHELGHLVLLPFTYPFTPRWVAEAGAMYLAEERREQSWALGLQQGIFENFSFADLHEEDQLNQLHYAYANAAALYLVEQEGAETFWQFYRNFRDADSTAESGRLLGLLYGFDAEELDERTREWMRDAVGDTAP